MCHSPLDAVNDWVLDKSGPVFLVVIISDYQLPKTLHVIPPLNPLPPQVGNLWNPKNNLSSVHASNL
jgi:hypothetical protein